MCQSDEWAIEGHKCIVYASSVGMPVFPSKLWHDDIMAVTGTAIGLQGSGVVISGGYLRDTPETSEIMQCGVITMLHPEGARFVERALAPSLKSDSQVFLMYLDNQETTEQLNPILRQRGFDMLSTRGIGRYSPIITIAVGPASELSGIEWLEDVSWATSPLFVTFGSDCPKLVKILLDCASGCQDLELLEESLEEDIARSPEYIGELLHGYEACATFGGPDGNHIAVTLKHLDISSIQHTYREIATDLGMPLYYVGDINAPDPSGHHFLEFHAFDAWRAVPEHWIQEHTAAGGT